MWIRSLSTTTEPLIWENNLLLRVMWVISNLAPLLGRFDCLIDWIRFSLGFFLKPLSDTKKNYCLFRYMLNSTRSNKETQLLFSSDPASLERSIRKGRHSSSIDNNNSSSLDSRQPPSTQTLVSSTDTRSPPSIEDILFPSTDIFHPTLLDTPVRTSINTEPRDMVATLILVRDDQGDLYD